MGVDLMKPATARELLDRISADEAITETHLLVARVEAVLVEIDRPAKSAGEAVLSGRIWRLLNGEAKP
jgi:hypothetical protein